MQTTSSVYCRHTVVNWKSMILLRPTSGQLLKSIISSFICPRVSRRVKTKRHIIIQHYRVLTIAVMMAASMILAMVMVNLSLIEKFLVSSGFFSPKLLWFLLRHVQIKIPPISLQYSRDDLQLFEIIICSRGQSRLRMFQSPTERSVKPVTVRLLKRLFELMRVLI